ncbi:phage repressor protein [Sphingomonas sp. ABOLE]|uniref:phage repressor protein n=1 Tax=Sphingomonas sp. ABOLE TaxID=1985878 RepID=UPI001F49B81B|nr:phage repressor protein [Sphingomonas sp. ABOLE]
MSHRLTYAQLSRILGRPDGYIARHIREQIPYELAQAERARAAEFFGVPGPYLDAPPRKSERQARAEQRRFRPNYHTVLRRAT